MKLVIGCDHGALGLKEEIKKFLAELAVSPLDANDPIEVNDIGTYTPDSVDYPDIAVKLCREINEGRAERGILLCGTGIGISIAANKIKGIRAALCADVFSAKMSREHNDANVICLGGRVTGPGPAVEIIRAYLSSTFAGGRHARRVGKIMDLENI